ncbi:MAG: hypothetical protein DRO90_01760, partial [Candidatus Altiarchaeales archaeon]
MHSLNTYNNGEWTTTAVKNVGISSFQVTQELAEASGTITMETIGWIAIESGKTGTINDIKYETGSSTDGNNDGVDNDGHTISFSQNFTKSPLILVKQDTHNGGDGGWARGFGTHSSTQHLTCTEEDQASDSERAHTDERFGFWAIESPVKIDDSQNFTRIEFGDVLDDALGDSRDEFVITAWVYPLSLNNSVRSNNGIENIFFTKQGIIELGIDAEGRLKAYLNAQNKEATGIYGTQGAIQLNAWTYIAVRYNKSDVDVYIGDEWYREAVGSTAEPWSDGGTLKEGGNLTIGSDMISGIIFNGSIDEVSVFNGSISDVAVEEHAGPEIIKVSCSVLKEDGTGNWTPITTNGEVQEGYLNFYSNVSKNDVDWLAFYLTEAEPDLLNPDESSWYMIANFTTNEDEYYFLMDSWDIPDNDSWYLAVKCRDASSNVVYDYYNIHFAINHFNDLLNLTYIDKGGRINYISNIGVSIEAGHEEHLDNVKLFVNYSGQVDYLDSFTRNDLESNYWLIPLASLNSWVQSKGLSPGNHDLNFIIECNLTYSIGKNYYIYNYTLNDTILDILGPEIELIMGSSYTFVLGSTFDDESNNLLIMGINSSDPHFDHVKVQYKYNTPATSEWTTIGTYNAVGSIANISIDITNFRDDNVSLRFFGYDDLNNEYLLESMNYWFIKNFNNHESIITEGLNNTILYSLDQNKLIDLDLKIIPYDNDIDKIIISTNYESFTLTNFTSEDDHIAFLADGTSNVDVKLNSSYYNVFGSEFANIPVKVLIYQGETIISSKTVVITVTTSTFKDVVAISNLEADINSSKFWLTFINYKNAYNNSHSIPFIVNNAPPTIKIYNSLNELIKTIKLYPDIDGTEIDEINIGSVKVEDNKFIVPLPTFTSGEACSIEAVNMNGSFYDFSYFIDQSKGEVYITLLTSKNLDGVYGTGAPINITYGISTSFKSEKQFSANFDFNSIPQDNYTFFATFNDISGAISKFISHNVTIDLKGPDIYKQFEDGLVINSESGMLEFIVKDISGIDSYWWNASISGYWSIFDDEYTFVLNDTAIQEGQLNLLLTFNDTLGKENHEVVKIILDRTAPEFSDVNAKTSVENDLLLLNFTITESNDYSIKINLMHQSTGLVYQNYEYVVIEKTSGKWTISIDFSRLSCGYYDIEIVGTDVAGNQNSTILRDIYIDNVNVEIESVIEKVIVGGEQAYNDTIDDVAYFNEIKRLFIEALDEVFDDFNLTSYDPLLASQLGIKNITFYFTLPLAWHDITLTRDLNYEILSYEIEGYDDPLKTDLKAIKSIQLLKIGNYTIDKFEIYTEGSKLIVKIDEQYRYLLSPDLSDKVEALFYEYEDGNQLSLIYDDSLKMWKLTSPGKDYFNISKYLTLSEGESFLFWFELGDGFGNVILSNKFKGIFDNQMVQEPSGAEVFEWNLGTNSTGAGVIILGTESYPDSTIVLNASTILPPTYDDFDVDRIQIYGSKNGQAWEYLGRAMYTGDGDIWKYYWDGSNFNGTIPKNYELKALFFDKAGNYLEFMTEVALFDYSTVKLLTDLVFGEVFKYNATAINNINEINGTIMDLFDTASMNLWDVVAEYYDPDKLEWVPLYLNSTSIVLNGSDANYNLVWDINSDSEFHESMREFKYNFLPLEVAKLTSKDLWGTWGKFGANAWQPILISESDSKLDITIYKFDEQSGWLIDSTLSVEEPIPSVISQAFKLFDLNGDGTWEIIRRLPSQLDIMHFNGTRWLIKTNVTKLNNIEYLVMDID